MLPKGVSQAANRNKDAILSEFKTRFAAEGDFLEIASGTGQHIVHFAKAFPGWQFQPSDHNDESITSIASYIEESGLGNIARPVKTNVLEKLWHRWRSDVIFAANLIHIAPPAVTPALFEGASFALNPGGTLYTYGPYQFEGKHRSESNVQFDMWLKDKDPSFGVRDMDWLRKQASVFGVVESEIITMPANNFLIAWKKEKHEG